MWGFPGSSVIADKNRQYALSQNYGRSENFIISHRNAVPVDAKERLAGRFFQCSHYYSIAENEVCRRSSFSGRIQEVGSPPTCFGTYAFSSGGRVGRYGGEFRGFFGSSTVCDGNEQKNGKKPKTGLKKTGIAPIVY